MLVLDSRSWVKVKNPNVPAVKRRGGGGLGAVKSVVIARSN
jgi:hypothetical protein